MNGPGVHDPNTCPLCSPTQHPSPAETQRQLEDHPLPTQRDGRKDGDS